MGVLAWRLKGLFQYTLLALGSSRYGQVGLVLALVAFPLLLLPERYALAVGILGACIGLGHWVLSFVREQQAVSDLLLVPSPAPDHAVTALGGGGVHVVSTSAGRMLVGPATGAAAALACRPTPLTTAYRLPPELQDAKARIIGRFRANGEDVVDAPALALDYDVPRLDSVTHAGQLRLLRASYFDFKCSADLAGSRLVNRSGATLIELAPYLLDTAGVLRDPARTRLANVVGVSTLAVTSDGAVLLVRQSPRNAASRDRLAPSGSGSLEPRDWREGQTLAQLAIAGAERELREESLIRPEEIAETVVVGWGRWLERGGKPEFFCVSVLRVTAAEVSGRRHRGVEKRHTHGVPLAVFPPEVRRVTEVADARAVIASIERRSEPYSLPLEATLRLAGASSPNGERAEAVTERG